MTWKHSSAVTDAPRLTCAWCRKPPRRGRALHHYRTAEDGAVNLCGSCHEQAVAEDRYCDRIDALVTAIDLLNRLALDATCLERPQIIRVRDYLQGELDNTRYDACPQCGHPRPTEDLHWIDGEIVCTECRGDTRVRGTPLTAALPERGRTDHPVSMPDTPVEF